MGILKTYQTWRENGSLPDDEGKADITKEPKSKVTYNSITDVDLILASTLPTQTSINQKTVNLINFS